MPPDKSQQRAVADLSESEGGHLARFLSSPTCIGLVSFAAIALMNLPALHDPPTWDGAMGVHPAAITLSRTGFDLSGLLRQPTYMQGGPNTHSLSLVTWSTALFYRWLSTSDGLFALMHVCHFALAAIAVAGVYRFARPAVGGRLAVGLCALVICNPVVLAQSGCLYLEIPLLATTMAALISWSDRRWLLEAFLCLVSFYIKETGLILAGALAAAALIGRGDIRVRVARAIAVLGPCVVGFCVNAAVTRPTGATAYVPPPFLEYFRFNLLGRVTPLPDLCAAVVLFLAATAVRWRGLWCTLRQPEAASLEAKDRARMSAPVAMSHLFVLSFIGFFLLAPFVAEVYLLPRYFVQIIPCLALALVDAARRIAPERLVLAGMAVCALLFLGNLHGSFYARIDTNDGSLAERSLEYRDLFHVQREALRQLETNSLDAPVFYGLPEHFLVSYPEMGFVSLRPENGHCVFLESPYDRARLSDFPSSFYIVLDYPALGGQRLFAILSQATRLRWNVRPMGDLRQGHYRAMVLEISSSRSAQQSTQEG